MYLSVLPVPFHYASICLFMKSINEKHIDCIDTLSLPFFPFQFNDVRYSRQAVSNQKTFFIESYTQ